MKTPKTRIEVGIILVLLEFLVSLLWLVQTKDGSAAFSARLIVVGAGVYVLSVLLLNLVLSKQIAESPLWFRVALAGAFLVLPPLIIAVYTPPLYNLFCLVTSIASCYLVGRPNTQKEWETLQEFVIAMALGSYSEDELKRFAQVDRETKDSVAET